MIMWADACTWAASEKETENNAFAHWDDSLPGGSYFACVAFRHGGKADVALLDGSVRKDVPSGPTQGKRYSLIC